MDRVQSMTRRRAGASRPRLLKPTKRAGVPTHLALRHLCGTKTLLQRAWQTIYSVALPQPVGKVAT